MEVPAGKYKFFGYGFILIMSLVALKVVFDLCIDHGIIFITAKHSPFITDENI